MKKNIIKIFVILTLTLIIAVIPVMFTACDKTNESVYEGGKKFGIDTDHTDIMGIKGAELNLMLKLILNSDNTYFEFKEDGYLHGQLQTRSGIIKSIESIISMIGGSNQEVEIGDMLANIDLSGMVNAYVEPMFPGFTDKLKAGDLEGALGLIKSSLGFNITGLDFDDEQIIEAVKYIGETMRLPANLFEIIPKDTVLTLTFDTQYARRKVTTTSGDKIDAVYLGYKVKDNPSTQPFGVFTESKIDDKTALALKIEFMNIDIGLMEV